MVLSAMRRRCFLKCLIIFARSPASANSSTMFSSLSSIKEAKYLMTLGWSSCYSYKEKPTFILKQEKERGETTCYRTCNNCISFMQSSLDLASTISKICTFFKATMDRFARQVARWTTENCPLPICLSKR